MPYLNITFWMLIGFTLGWFTHQWQQDERDLADTQFAFQQDESGPVTASPASRNNAPQNKVPLNTFRKTLASQDVPDIIETYQQTARQNPDLKEDLSSDLVNHVEKLLRQNERKEAQQLLTQYIEVDPYNARALLLQAESLFGAARYKEAVLLAIEAKVYSHDATLTERADAMILEISRTYEKRLVEARQWSEMAELFSMLLAKDPGHHIGERYYKLGRAQYQQGLYRQAIETLRQASYYDAMRYKAQALLDLIEQLLELDTNLLTIPISKTSSGWVISVVINDEYIAKLLIDTGASGTILSDSYAQTIELYKPPKKETEDEDGSTDDAEGTGEDGDKVLVRTASDVIEMPLKQVEILDFGEISMKKVVVGILKMPDNGGIYDGLLGMDILSQFDFKLDQENEFLYFNFDFQ